MAGQSRRVKAMIKTQTQTGSQRRHLALGTAKPGVAICKGLTNRFQGVAGRLGTRLGDEMHLDTNQRTLGMPVESCL